LDNIWKNPRGWPMDPAGYVFIARAVNLIGSAMLGETWPGGMPAEEWHRPIVLAMPPTRSLPEVARTLADHEAGWQALQRIPPALQLRHGQVDFASADTGSHSPTLTPQLWRIARQIVEEESAQECAAIEASNAAAKATADASNLEIRERFDLFLTVAKTIVACCEAGEIASAMRQANGGGLVKIRTDWWNTENWGVRFSHGQFDPQDPFSHNPPYSNAWLIFFSRPDVDRFIADQACSAPLALDETIHFSPYLKVMLAAIRRAGVTSENQPTKASLEAEIAALWTGPLRLSNRLRAAMATLIREPESQKGRNKG
jgi:hypothetical protein